jgi:hypothetical protein
MSAIQKAKASFDFSSMFGAKGSIVSIKIGNAETFLPDKNKNYMIIGGHINHVTGTATEIYLLSQLTNGENIEYIGVIPAATGSAYTPLFGLLAGQSSAHFIFIPKGSGWNIYVIGDSAAYVYLTLLEW